jgi:Protein of unknown function (DUF1553)/Protein of unknown function (DUF1549)/Planctomycete cytochrome C
MRSVVFFGLLLTAAIVIPVRSEEKGRTDQDPFTSKVRPILARHCFKCHGPDDKARKAKLRLDVRDQAVKPAASGAIPIVPDKPDESELVQRIFAEDANERMPPPAAKVPLSDADKRVLKKWIADGAEYKTHWAFIPPRPCPPPRVRHAEWPQNAIDTFILARLETAGMRPSERADPETLIRRLSLDLVGLPPTPEEVGAFLQDRSPAAYEKLVDRLLASPHYGERWARRWLDLARYADTNGYEKDRTRSIWPYRDWVITALNTDMPFDRFTVEQLAGDLLPDAMANQKIATGFHRNTMFNEEGGIDPQEFRFYAMTDRVATTATVWLGLTLGCAQCHTHKFDPIPHRDYYQFMALLNNADEPEMSVTTPETERNRHELEAKIAALVADLPNRFPPVEKADGDDRRTALERRKANLESRFIEWAGREAAQAVRWSVLRPTRATANLPHLSIEEDGSIFASGDQSKRDLYDLRFSTGLKRITAIRLEVLPDDRLPHGGPGRVFYEGTAGDFFLSELTVRAGDKPVILKQATASGQNGKAVAAAIDGDPQTGWSLGAGQGQPHAAVFQLAAPLNDADDLVIQLLFERYYAAGLGRFRISVTTDPQPITVRDTPTEIVNTLLTPEAQRSAEQNVQLRRHFLMIAPELAKERAAIEELRKGMPSSPTTLILQERPADNPRPSFIHNRGEYLQPTDRVQPAVLSILPPLPKDVPPNRLALARWLVSPDNPLSARVTMNRQWAVFFGRGIVRTAEDFGYQGEPPSHPELLDWLALELPRQGWSMKRMHKLIVMSATYQQSSRATSESLADDPENRLLARGPRVRLEAEVIRDANLRASGLLSDRIGGPSVFPPQPAGVTTEGTYGGLDWKASPGGDRYRRGLYTFTKRTAPFAMATTFDAPSGEVCVARREVSNTPLQALTLLNDPVFEEAAQTLGRMMAARGGPVEERVDILFRRCLTRTPDRDEVSQLARFFLAQKRRFDLKELDAATIAGPGDGQGEANERAAWTVLARVLLNLDEAVTKG